MMAEKETVVAAPPVYSKEEIYRYVDLGLGRGVDGTDLTPWLNKSSFQVRRVKFENIVGTDEGSSLQSYEKEISSVRSQQSKMKSSITIPNSPVSIGTEAELSRSVHSTRRSTGRKIINRTISFRDNFNDVPFGNEICSTDECQNFLTFEERLCEWLLQHLTLEWQKISHGEDKKAIEIPKEKHSLQNLSAIIEQKRQVDLKLIAEGCKKFVKFFHITHYVSSIELGATEYQVMSQEEYNTALSIGGKVGVQGVGEVETKQELAAKKKIGSKEKKYIGRISKDNIVKRGSLDEAVVNVNIRPITTLIKSAFLNTCMQDALTEYMEIQNDKSDGPFIISCGVGETLYLFVNPINNAVMATNDVSKASEFCIVPNDDDKSGHNEFFIIYNKPQDDIALYLHAPVNFWGENQGPLYVRDTVQQKTSRFVLNERIIGDDVSRPSSIETWINGSNMFYINCSRRAFRRDGYFAVKKSITMDEMHITCCVGDVNYHDNINVWMLFRLITKSQNQEVSKDAIQEPEELPTVQAEGTSEKDIELHEM